MKNPGEGNQLEKNSFASKFFEFSRSHNNFTEGGKSRVPQFRSTLKRARKKVKSGPEKAERISWSYPRGVISRVLVFRFVCRALNLGCTVEWLVSLLLLLLRLNQSCRAFIFFIFLDVYWKFSWKLSYLTRSIRFIIIVISYNNTFVFGRLSIICLFERFEFVRWRYRVECIGWILWCAHDIVDPFLKFIMAHDFEDKRIYYNWEIGRDDNSIIWFCEFFLINCHYRIFISKV